MHYQLPNTGSGNEWNIKMVPASSPVSDITCELLTFFKGGGGRSDEE